MKKSFLKFAVAIAAVAFIGVSCTEDDITSPTITITGDAAITLNLGDSYTDAGATADDDKDGDLTSQITTTGTVNVNEVGVYEIVYTVEDEAGNSTSETRTVTVKADRLAGSYNVHAVITGAGAGTYDFVETVTASSVTTTKFSSVISATSLASRLKELLLVMLSHSARPKIMTGTATAHLLTLLSLDQA